MSIVEKCMAGWGDNAMTITTKAKKSSHTPPTSDTKGQEQQREGNKT